MSEIQTTVDTTTPHSVIILTKSNNFQKYLQISFHYIHEIYIYNNFTLIDKYVCKCSKNVEYVYK